MKDWQTVADKALLRKPKDERLNDVFIKIRKNPNIF